MLSFWSNICLKKILHIPLAEELSGMGNDGIKMKIARYRREGIDEEVEKLFWGFRVRKIRGNDE